MPKPPLPTSSDDRARAYLNVLFEINARINLIKTIKSTNMLLPGIAREVCHLQLRHICELIVIGCLVIQGDYKSSPVFRDEYNPKKVFRELERHYPKFFPLPAIIQKDDKGNINDVKGIRLPGALSRKGLESLWETSGRFLHRLRIHNFLEPSHWPVENLWPDLDAHIEQLETLLQSHIISMYDPQILVLAGLSGNNGKPDLTFVIFRENNVADLRHFHGRGETPYWENI